jgi:tetratricopeptide (TPR) repeat protein
MRSAVRIRSLVLALVLVLGWAASAANAEAQSSRYRALIESAILEYNAGNWDEARLLFQQAHAIEPTARTWRGMGLADYERRDYVAAIAELEAALANAHKPLSKSQRDEAARALDQARRYAPSTRSRCRRARRSSWSTASASRFQLKAWTKTTSSSSCAPHVPGPSASESACWKPSRAVRTTSC